MTDPKRTAWNSTLPVRKTGLSRQPFPPGSSSLSKYGVPGRGTGVVVPLRAPIKPVSTKRARENRERAAMADRRWPGRRDGNVLCAVWEAMQPDWCERRASDLHEIVRRSQGGSITDEENTLPTCRTCNGLLADGPDWGYRIGVIRHDALCCEGRKICSRYDDQGDAA